jgi:UDP-N-acetyl-D-glucosamine/UDP-N-acetyl-D-galactosamine dehydrogenase
VVGYDIDAVRIGELRAAYDRTGEIPSADLAAAGLRLSDDPAILDDADLHIITAPTPLTPARQPDLAPLLAAAGTVGRHLAPGGIVVFESTVYPGATEEACVPVLEAASRMIAGRDFGVAYSPERINPGDGEHRFETIAKVVAASDPATLDTVAAVYGRVVRAGIHRAPDIRTAEAAKVIENTQRDLNIALMNELSMICARLGLDTRNVLDCAATKWNFLRFTPGLVGGHCVSVDPFYLTHAAERAGHHPEIILAGRRLNDGYGAWIARETVKRMLGAGASGGLRVGVLGITFKPDVPDVRNSRVVDLVRELESYGVSVRVADPKADPATVRREHGVSLTPPDAVGPVDAVVLAVAHCTDRAAGWPPIEALLDGGRGLVVDVQAVLDRRRIPAGIILWRP